MRGNVLFVDDERAILKTCQRLLRGGGLNVFIAEDGPAALDILAVEQMDIIISDVRMPGMDGHQLLRKVRELYPSTIRLLLSGHAEDKEIIRAILDGSCKMCILKPWDSQMLRKTIQQLLAVKEVLQARKLTAIVDKLDSLLISPRLFRKLMDLINQEAEMQEIAAVIAEVIAEDPAMTARVLHLVNSAFYGEECEKLINEVINMTE